MINYQNRVLSKRQQKRQQRKQSTRRQQQRKQSKRRQQQKVDNRNKHRGGGVFDTIAGLFGYVDRNQYTKLAASFDESTTLLADKTTKINDLTKKITELQEQQTTSDTSQRLDQAQKELAKVKQEQEQLIKQLDDKTTSLTKINEEITELTNKKSLTEAQNTELQRLLAQKDSLLAELTSKNTQLQSEIATKESEMEVLKSKVDKSDEDNREIERLGSEIDALTIKLSEKQKELESQQAKDVREDREAALNKRYLEVVTDWSLSKNLPTDENAAVYSGALYNIEIKPETDVSKVTCAGIELNSTPSFRGFIKDNKLHFIFPHLYGVKPFVIDSDRYNLTFSSVPNVDYVVVNANGTITIHGSNLELIDRCLVNGNEVYFQKSDNNNQYTSDRVVAENDGIYDLQIYNKESVYIKTFRFEKSSNRFINSES